MLLEWGANLDTKNNFDKTTLHYASEMGHTEIVQLLLDKGADPNAKDNHDKTPLHWAAENEHLESVRLLRMSGADVRAFNDEGKMPADKTRDANTKAMLEKPLKELGREWILEHKPDISLDDEPEKWSNKHKRDAFDQAVSVNNVAAVKYMMEDAQHTFGPFDTALHSEKEIKFLRWCASRGVLPITNTNFISLLNETLNYYVRNGNYASHAGRGDFYEDIGIPFTYWDYLVAAGTDVENLLRLSRTIETIDYFIGLGAKIGSVDDDFLWELVSTEDEAVVLHALARIQQANPSRVFDWDRILDNRDIPDYLLDYQKRGQKQQRSQALLTPAIKVKSPTTPNPKRRPELVPEQP